MSSRTPFSPFTLTPVATAVRAYFVELMEAWHAD